MVRLPRQTVIFFAAFFCALALSACAGIPGESEKKIQTLYREFYSLGQEYESVKNYDRAISCYEKACQDKTLYDSAYYRIGLCAVQQKKWNLAEEVFTYFVKKDPQNTTLLLSLAYVQAQSGHLEKAAESYQSLYLAHNNNASVLKNYCAVLIELKENEKAKEVLDELVQKFPDDTSIQLLRSKISE